MQRGHFFLVDIENEKELLELLGRGIFDACNVESHAIVSFKDLFEFFDKNPPKQ